MSLKHIVEAPLIEEFPRFNEDPYLPANAARIMIIGSSGSGKTALITNMLLKGWLSYDNLFIYAKSLDQSIYKTIYKFADGLGLLNNGIYMYDSLKDMINIDELKNSERNIILVDDFFADKKDINSLEDIMFRSRHKNITFLLLGQYFFRIPKSFRGNSSHWAIFKNGFGNKIDYKKFIEDTDVDIDEDEFKLIIRKVYNEEYNFLWIDKETSDPRLKFRKGLDLMYINGNFEPLNENEYRKMKIKAKRLYNLPPVSEEVEEEEPEIEEQTGGKLFSIEQLDEMFSPCSSWVKPK